MTTTTTTDEEYCNKHELWNTVENISSMLIATKPREIEKSIINFLEMKDPLQYTISEDIMSSNETEAYLISNRVAELLEGLLKNVISSKPSDPTTSMIKYLQDSILLSSELLISGDETDPDAHAVFLLCRHIHFPSPKLLRYAMSQGTSVSINIKNENRTISGGNNVLRFLAENFAPEYLPRDLKRMFMVNESINHCIELSDSEAFQCIIATGRGDDSGENPDHSNQLQQSLLSLFPMDHQFTGGPTLTIADFALIPYLYLLSATGFKLHSLHSRYLEATYLELPSARDSLTAIDSSVKKRLSKR